MMNKSKRNKMIIFSLIYILVGLIISYFGFKGIDVEMQVNFFILLITYYIIFGTLLILNMYRSIDIFEPIVLISFIYLIMFCIVPITNIINNDYYFFGMNLMDNLPKATLIFIISYFAFIIGYYSIIKNRKIMYKSIYIELGNDHKMKVLKNSYLVWTVCYIITILQMMSGGTSLFYIITFGLGGAVDISQKSQVPTGFLGMFSYCMIPAYMYIHIYSRRTLNKIIIFLLTLSTFMIKGFRFIIIILVFAPIIFYYLKNNKRPRFKTLIIIALITVIMIGGIGFMRGDVRLGNEVDWSLFNFEFIIDAVKENFDIYNTFYAMVGQYPNNIPFTLGTQIFGNTLIMFIPRLIWPDKKLFGGNSAELYLNKIAAESGTAAPNIGEFYTEFGVIGCIIFMFIFGIMCSYIKKYYRGKYINDNTLVIYSILLPSCLQLVIRGYTPSNFYLILFLMIPIIFIQNFSIKKGKCLNEFK